MDIIKIKEFHDAKFTIKNMKRQPTEKKKIMQIIYLVRNCILNIEKVI